MVWAASCEMENRCATVGLLRSIKCWKDHCSLGRFTRQSTSQCPFSSWHRGWVSALELSNYIGVAGLTGSSCMSSRFCIDILWYSSCVDFKLNSSGAWLLDFFEIPLTWHPKSSCQVLSRSHSIDLTVHFAIVLGDPKLTEQYRRIWK